MKEVLMESAEEMERCRLEIIRYDQDKETLSQENDRLRQMLFEKRGYK
jgi:hypothetical protein